MTMAQWLDRRTGDRGILGSRILLVALPLRNVANSVYPTLPVSFGGDTKSRRYLLSGVYARGSKISHTGGQCVTCVGLHNSTPALAVEWVVCSNAIIPT